MGAAFIEIAVSFFFFVLLTLFSEALKHLIDRTKTFNLEIFYLTNVKPSIYSLAAGLLIAAASVFTPDNFSPFIKVLTNGEVDVSNMTALYASAVPLGMVIKQLFKTPTEEVEDKLGL